MFFNNITKFFYFYFRFFPLFLISFFIINSIYYNNFFGIINILGISILSLIFIFISSNFLHQLNNNSNPMCYTNTILENSYISYFPLSSVVYVFSFVFFYFFHINYYFVLFIFLLLLIDSIWIFMNSCFNYIQIISSIIISFVFSYIWFKIFNTNLNINNEPAQCSTFNTNVLKCRYI